MKIAAPRSLIGQFALLHLLTAMIAAATLPVGVAVLLHRVAQRYQHQVLGQQAQRVAALLRTHDAGEAVDTADILAGGLTLTIVDRTRRIVAERGPPRPAIVRRLALHHGARMARYGSVAVVSREVGDRWIVVSQDDAAPEVVTDDIVTTFLKRFALLLVPLMLLIPLIGVWLTQRLTRRMIAASEIAAAIGPRTLNRRLPRDTLPSEVEPLAVATNAALDRLEHAFAAQAAFAADVAHELRTPLATIRLQADAVTDADTRQALLAGVDRAARVIAQLWGLADLERPMDEARAPVDLYALAEQVVAEQAPLVLRSGRQIELQGGAVASFPGYPGAIMLTVENLIDNAVRHTPAGTRIVVAVGPGAQMCVSDDGPPIDAARRAHMAQRFWRGDRRAEGAGLGLSIVARVAAAHGGALHLDAGTDGRGLCARVMLAGVRQ